MGLKDKGWRGLVSSLSGETRRRLRHFSPFRLAAVAIGIHGGRFADVLGLCDGRSRRGSGYLGAGAMVD